MAGVKVLRDYCVSPHHPPMTNFVTSVQNLKDDLVNVAYGILFVLFMILVS